MNHMLPKGLPSQSRFAAKPDELATGPDRSTTGMFSIPNGRWRKGTIMRDWATVVVAVALTLSAGMRAEAFDIAADRQIDGETPQLVGEGAGNTVIPSGASPNWLYNWTDRDGDGSSNTVVEAGLNLGARILYCGRPNGTSRGEIVLDLAGGDLTGSSETAIRTRRHDPEGATRNERLGSSDDIVLRNVGSVDMGGIDAQGWHEYISTDYQAGDIVIGSLWSRANAVRVGYLYAFAVGGRARAGDITVYASGDVIVADNVGNPGDIRTDTAGWSGGDIRIDHYGRFQAGRILTHTDGDRTSAVRAGDVDLNGNDSSGDAQIGEITGWNNKGNYSSSDRALFVISNYRDVNIGDIDGAFIGGNVGRYGADLYIDTGISGNIEITGLLDLHSVYGNNAFPAYRGSARLACDGTVTLATLDLNLLQYILLDAGAGFSGILGELAGFDTASGSGSGTESDPYLATQTALRVPNGQIVFYSVQDGHNAALGGHVYRVADSSGIANAGGLLAPAPEPVPGAMFRVL